MTGDGLRVLECVTGANRRESAAADRVVAVACSPPETARAGSVMCVMEQSVCHSHRMGEIKSQLGVDGDHAVIWSTIFVLFFWVRICGGVEDM